MDVEWQNTHRYAVLRLQRPSRKRQDRRCRLDLRLGSAFFPAVVVVLMRRKQDDLHAPLVTEFSKQGYHILCEKPMATSISDCVKMVKEVQSGERRIFGIGHGGSLGCWSRAKS